MSFSKAIISAASLALLAGVNAHSTMKKPVPYGPNTVSSSPLGKGLNFPCQSGGRPDAFDSTGVSNPMTAGEPQSLEFTGSAVHGGGSCQLSVTYDHPPPADKSKWRVIHTIIGGCPSNAAGNIDEVEKDENQRPTGRQCRDGEKGDCLNKFQFQIPKGMRNGNATFAWSWFNKIGNREMYMNCAPIQISGGSEDDTFYNSLPEIFVANIENECTTGDGVLDIPNPGQSVVHGDEVAPNSLGTCTGGGSSGGSSGGTPYGGSNTGSPSSPVASVPEETPSDPSYNPGGVFAPGASPSPAPENSQPESGNPGYSPGYGSPDNSGDTGSPSTPDNSSGNTGSPDNSGSYGDAHNVVTPENPSSVPENSGSPTPYPGNENAGYLQNPAPQPGSGQCTEGRVSCPEPAGHICVGESKFGICGIDYCALPQDLAAGMYCRDSKIMKKRSLRSSHHGRAHRKRLVNVVS